MENLLEERIRKAVLEGLEARSAYYASIGLANEQQLGAPAPELLLIDLETKLGRSLPPSYRAFLSLHNGWRMIDGVTDLLSVEEMLDGPRATRAREWQQEAAKAGDEEVAARALVIGVAEITPTKILLDPETTDTNGEWTLIEYHKGVEGEHPSFIDWLEASNDDYRQLAESPETFD